MKYTWFCTVSYSSFWKDVYIIHNAVHFRWKGENVSTVEVSNVIGSLGWVDDDNVFGVTVPGKLSSNYCSS